MSIRQYSGKAGAKIEVKPLRHKMFSDIAFAAHVWVGKSMSSCNRVSAQACLQEPETWLFFRIVLRSTEIAHIVRLQIRLVEATANRLTFTSM